MKLSARQLRAEVAGRNGKQISTRPPRICASLQRHRQRLRYDIPPAEVSVFRSFELIRGIVAAEHCRSSFFAPL